MKRGTRGENEDFYIGRRRKLSTEELFQKRWPYTSKMECVIHICDEVNVALAELFPHLNRPARLSYLGWLKPFVPMRSIIKVSKSLAQLGFDFKALETGFKLPMLCKQYLS